MEPIYKLPTGGVLRPANPGQVEFDSINREVKPSDVENVINKTLEDIVPVLERLEKVREALMQHDWATYEHLLTETYLMAQRLVEDKMTIAKAFHVFFKETCNKIMLMHQVQNERTSPHSPYLRRF